MDVRQAVEWRADFPPLDLSLPDPTAVQARAAAPSRDAIQRAVQTVCRGWLRQDAPLVERVAVEDGGVVAGPMQGMGNGGFVGECNGSVDLGKSDEWAEEALGEIPGMSPAAVASEGPDVRTDAISELTPMTVGGCKNALCNLGDPGKRTRLTIECGQALEVGALKGPAQGDDFFTDRFRQWSSDGAPLSGGGRPGLAGFSARAVPTDDRRRRRPERGRSARARARDLGATRRGR